MRATYGEFIAKASLFLAILAYFPSMAPFTPALGGAILAVPGALIGAFSGWYRCAILTLYFALATFPVSPVFFLIERYVDMGLLVRGTLLFGLILAIGLYIHHRKSTQ